MGKVKNWTVEKKDAIEAMLITIWASIGMDIPENFEDIVQDCYEDVCETADPVDWHSGDVAIAFRRWIEKQGKQYPETGEFAPMEGQIGLTECRESGQHLKSCDDDGFCNACGCQDGTIGLDGIYGVQLNTVGELRDAISELSDDDQICIEACDEHGEVEDLYPMHLDVIEGIKLTDDSVVNEVRFCQRPNSAPDTRDKTELVDAVIKQLMSDYRDGDQTVLDELLRKLPWEILKGSLPEEQWTNFN